MAAKLQGIFAVIRHLFKTRVTEVTMVCNLVLQEITDSDITQKIHQSTHVS